MYESDTQKGSGVSAIFGSLGVCMVFKPWELMGVIVVEFGVRKKEDSIPFGSPH